MPGNRLSTRLSDYDYRYGAFFISLVVENRERLFGEIVNKEVRLSLEGQIVMEEWLRTPIIRKSVQLDEWIVMPDHFQAIAFIDNGTVGGRQLAPLPIGGTIDPGQYRSNPIHSTSVPIIGANDFSIASA